MRNLLLALVALLVAAGCGDKGGGVIEPEKKAASSPLDHAPKPPTATTP